MPNSDQDSWSLGGQQSLSEWQDTQLATWLCCNALRKGYPEVRDTIQATLHVVSLLSRQQGTPAGTEVTAVAMIWIVSDSFEPKS